MSKDIQQLKQSKILVIGDSCTDVYSYGSCERISPEAPVPILKVTKTESRPGMALNVKEGLERLGNSVDMLTNSEKITKERFVCEKNMQHVLRVDRGENNLVTPMDLNVLNIQKYDCVVISDYNKGFLPEDVCRALVEKCTQGKKVVFVDSKKNDISCFEGCFIKINQLEYENIKRTPLKSELVVTLGSMGAMHNDIVYPTKKTEVFDVCGAGDSFLSGFVTKYLSCYSIPESIRYANKVASISVQNFGNYAPHLSEIG